MPKSRNIEFISLDGKRKIAREILSQQKLNIKTPKTQTLKEAKKSKAYKRFLIKRRIANKKIIKLVKAKRIIDDNNIRIFNYTSELDKLKKDIVKIKGKKNKKLKLIKKKINNINNKIKYQKRILKKRLSKQKVKLQDKDLTVFIHTYFNVWVLFGEESPKDKKSFSVSFNANFGSKGFFSEEFCKRKSKPSYYKIIDDVKNYIRNNPDKIKHLNQNKYTYQVYRIIKRKSGTFYQPLYYITKDAIKI